MPTPPRNAPRQKGQPSRPANDAHALRVLSLRESRFTSFDGGVSLIARHQRPDRYRAVEAHPGENPVIPRGGGYSYSAASFGARSIVREMTRFNRILEFDAGRGTICVESGATLGEILPFTARHGYWLPVQPGYPAITVGGCIAANVHGKNPHRSGAFLHSIDHLTLVHPLHGTVRLDPAETPEPFHLTIGGYGLTGTILSATLRLERLPGTRLTVERLPIGSLREGLDEVLRATEGSAFCYTWHDAAPFRKSFGAGFAYRGSFIPGGHQPEDLRARYRLLRPESRGRRGISFWGGPWRSRLLNLAFRRLESPLPARREISLFDSLFPFARRAEYFRLYGRGGLLEVQALVGRSATESWLEALRNLILDGGVPAALVSMKLFRGNPKFLRFERDGVCVTLNLPRTPSSLALLRSIDDLFLSHRALPHLIKDSRVPRDVAEACYPEMAHFRAALRRWDPERRYRSELSERLGL